MRRVNEALIVAAVALALTSISACEKKGPAERAGEQIDKAAENASDAGKDVGKKMGEAMEDAGEKMQGK
jgi:hyperosmotically inducible protein